MHCTRGVARILVQKDENAKQQIVYKIVRFYNKIYIKY